MRYAVVSHGGCWFWTDSASEARTLAAEHNGAIVDYKPGPRAGQGIIEEDD